MFLRSVYGKFKCNVISFYCWFSCPSNSVLLALLIHRIDLCIFFTLVSGRTGYNEEISRGQILVLENVLSLDKTVC